MNLNELRFIVAVAAERNFRRAAETCFISQPALSLAIQKLEEELGVKIFERSRSKVHVTDIGTRLVDQARRTLGEAARIKEIARSGTDQLSTPLHIGVIYTIGPYLLPELIPSLKRKAPHMPLEVDENLTVNLEAQLKEGKLDAILIALPFGGPGIETRALYDEPFEVVVPCDHAWAKKRNVKSAELPDEKVLLLDTGHCFSNQVVEACPDLSHLGGERRQGNSLETIRNMVASGLGITVLPASANVPKYRSRLTAAIPFAKPAPARRVALAWRSSFPRLKAIEALAEAVLATKLTGTQPVN